MRFLEQFLVIDISYSCLRPNKKSDSLVMCSYVKNDKIKQTSIIFVGECFVLSLKILCFNDVFWYHMFRASNYFRSAS